MREPGKQRFGTRDGKFNTTQWSVVLAAGDSKSPEFPSALETLCATYWYPLYAYIRKTGRSPADAKDLTQGFFARLVEARIHTAADPGRGKFRAFLLGALKRFLIDEARWEGRKKRGGDSTHVAFDESLAEDRYRRDLIEEFSPEQTFDREWAILTIEGVMERLREEYRSSGQMDRFETLCSSFMREENAATYEEMGRRLGLTREGTRSAAKRLRARFRSLFRERLALLIDTGEDLDAEVRHLIAAAGSGRLEDRGGAA